MLTTTFVPRDKLIAGIRGVDVRYSSPHDRDVIVTTFNGSDLTAAPFPRSILDLSMETIELAVQDHEIPPRLLDGTYSEAVTDKGDRVEAIVRTDGKGSRFLTVTFRHALHNGRPVVRAGVAFYSAREWLCRLLTEDASHLRVGR